MCLLFSYPVLNNTLFSFGNERQVLASAGELVGMCKRALAMCRWQMLIATLANTASMQQRTRKRDKAAASRLQAQPRSNGKCKCTLTRARGEPDYCGPGEDGYTHLPGPGGKLASAQPSPCEADVRCSRWLTAGMYPQIAHAPGTLHQTP